MLSARDLEKVIALTNDQKKDISRLYGISPKNIVVVGGGYDDSLFTRAPKPTPGTVHILYAGKFNRSKGVIWLLKSLNRRLAFAHGGQRQRTGIQPLHGSG